MVTGGGAVGVIRGGRGCVVVVLEGIEVVVVVW